MKHDHGPDEPPKGFWHSRHAVGLLVIGAVAGYFLLTEHSAHVLGALPYLLFLACPLMHLFMHHGHRHAKNDKQGTDDKESSHEPH